MTREEYHLLYLPVLAGCKYQWFRLDDYIKIINDSLKRKAIMNGYNTVVEILNIREVKWNNLTQKVTEIIQAFREYLVLSESEDLENTLKLLPSKVMWFNLPRTIPPILCQAIIDINDSQTITIVNAYDFCYDNDDVKNPSTTFYVTGDNYVYLDNELTTLVESTSFYTVSIFTEGQWISQYITTNSEGLIISTVESICG